MTKASTLIALLFVAMISISQAEPIPVPVSTVDTALSDTARHAIDSSAIKFFQNRNQGQFTPKRQPPKFSAVDSISIHYLRPETNLRSFADWSWHKDMADFLRATPSVIIYGRQVTPSRKDAYPFGLTGNRIAFTMDGFDISPLEPNPEPDGGLAVADNPLAPVSDVWFLPGAMSQLAGGKAALSTLYAVPWQFSDSMYHSSIHAQKGAYGYSDVRGAFAKRYADGRDITAALGYRDADGEYTGLSDNFYNYFTDIVWPISGSLDMHTTGYLSKKETVEQLWISPVSGGAFRRERFDRKLQIGIDSRSDSTRKSSLSYVHERDGSYLDGDITSRLNVTAHGGRAMHERMVGSAAVVSDLTATYATYDFGGAAKARFDVSGNIRYAQLGSGLRKTATAGFSHISHFRFLPRASMAIHKSDSSTSWLFGMAYSEQAPALSDLYLPAKSASLYSGSNDYHESGNSNLKSERQLIATLSATTGMRHSAAVNVAVGKIWDAVIWDAHASLLGTANASFSPSNINTEFATVDLTLSAQINDLIRWRGGAAWHHTKQENRDSIPYAPKYNAFTGGELHVKWKQTGTDLHAYGELVWMDSYYGYFGKTLGRDVAFNSKFTLALKDFHFFLVFQNLLLQNIEHREYYPTSSRVFYYGLTWWFED